MDTTMDMLNLTTVSEKTCGNFDNSDAFIRGEINVWGLVGLIIFYVAILAIGILASWKRRDVGENETERAIVAGRDIGLFVGIFTLTATWVGGGYINGTAEYVFNSDYGIVWTQAPWGYSCSLILGGLFFAKKMRDAEYTTMLEPFQDKYGRIVTALCFLPALTSELFWSAAILSALGTSLTVIIGLNNTWAIIISAGVVVLYTLAGGLFSVAYTDIVQLTCIFIGLWLAIPFAWTHEAVTDISETAYGDDGWVGTQNLNADPWVGNFIDSGLLLCFGGIPWQAYFQRVLSQKKARNAQILSVCAGLGCFLMAIPAAIIGAIGHSTDWCKTDYADVGPVPIPKDEYKLILPLVMQYLTPTWVAVIGLGAVSAAVMSSADSSTLSSSSLFTCNIYTPFRTALSDAFGLSPITDKEVMWVLRISIVCVATLSSLIALTINSVYGLFYLCGDFVYVLLFPQLTLVLYYKRGNTYGALCGFVIGAILRFTGGEPLLGLDAVIKYPNYDEETGTQLFPFKTLCMVCCFVSIILFSEIARFIYKTCGNDKLDVFGVFQEGGRSEKSNSYIMNEKNGAVNNGFKI